MKYQSSLLDRTKLFALQVIRLVEKLPHSKSANVLAGQLLRSGTSVGANYRAAQRAKSKADFIAKLKIVEEELDESLYWMELLIETNIIKEAEIVELMNEGIELLAMVVSSLKKLRLPGLDSSLKSSFSLSKP